MLFGVVKMNPSEKLCPNCQQTNDEAATICVHCGSDLLGGVPTSNVAPPVLPKKSTGSLQDYMGSVIDLAAIPEGGLGVRVAGELKPMYVPVDKELLLGRRTETSPDALLDLGILDGANLGVSRKHAIIRRTEFGFDVIDLASRNGTWLDNVRLTPNTPYRLKSGSMIRLGHLRLLVMYRPVPQKIEKNTVGNK